MAIYDYKDMNAEAVKQLFNDSYGVVRYTQYLIDAPEAGWKQLSAQTLNHQGPTDQRGTYYGEQSSVATAQAEVLGQYDDAGNLIKIGIGFRGTGGPSEAGIQDYLNDFKNNFQAAFDPKGFGTDYTYLAFGNLLSSVASYASQHGLTGEDITIAGASLGGMAVNSMADLSERRWDGFYKDSNYVGVVSPSISETHKVLNLGAENDPVYRLMGNGELTWASLGAHDSTNDMTTDNIISFNNHYASFWQNLLPHSVFNPLSWLVHDPAEIAAYLKRVADSELYDLTHEDSTIIVSSLGSDARSNTWVEDLGRYGSSHNGPTFILGTDTDDLLRGGAGNDYLEGGGGNDTFQTGGGDNLVLGGQGNNTLDLQGALNQFQLAYDSAKDGLNDGPDTLYIQDGLGGISVLSDIGTLTSQESSSNWLYSLFGRKDTVTHSVTIDGLRTDDHMTDYLHSVNGNANNNQLSATIDGDWLFGKNGDDILSSDKASVTFVGGNGNDVLNSQGGGNNTFLFHGNFGQDQVFGFHASDTLKFIGVDTIVDGSDYHSVASEVGNDTVLNFGANSVTLVGVGLNSLSSYGVTIA
ncbi:MULTISPECIES: calcium-binding protein [Pseudomonas]|uniref:calcium-binding protein n=1 Tax=Pseudomonas TaxID=286 RepID=UPI00099B337F|nr:MULTISPECIES: calcium-binding protein [Pseudomonas]MCK3838888.1 calcium-binding protein [Pseudomonas sp. NCIMB 10586]OPB05911.1 hypothetical protein BFW89_09840 [Pseudomonas synxantha]VCU67842.1 Lipase [Pseudomonas synxantha]